MKSPARAAICYVSKSPFVYIAFCLYVLLLFNFPAPGVSSFYFSPLSLPLCLPPYPLLFLLLTQGSCAADLYRHPQLDADIEAVKEIYSENSVSVRWDSTSEMAVDKPLLSELLKGWRFSVVW